MEFEAGIILRSEYGEAAEVRSVERERKRALFGYAAFGIFALAISLGFFLEGMRTQFASLSGDQFNLLAVCAKKDYPQLFEGDNLVGDIKNVDYYIPFFVNLVRLASLPDHNYVRGLNILLFITSLTFTWGWWLLFSHWGNKWAAALLAFLTRGIMWPPGHELWGIAGVWSMLPRTLFLALLPWVFWVWFRKRHSNRGWYLTCLLAGLIVNVHPLSGLCVAAAILTAEIVWTAMDSRSAHQTLARAVKGGLIAFVAMSPFIWTYVSMIGSTEGVDPTEFYEAARMRLKAIFWSPRLYLAEWLEPKWLALILLPWLGCLLLPAETRSANRRLLVALGVFATACVAISLLPFGVEAALNRLGFHHRFAFQLVRAGKYVIVPSIIVGGMLFVSMCTQLAKRRAGSLAVATFTIFLVSLTAFSRHPAFDRVPLLGDDVARFLWPGWPNPEAQNQESMENLLRWLRDNTAADAKFIGPREIRAGALRTVIHEFGGAGMLIEGNPKALVEAARRQKQISKRDPLHKSEILREWGADYWVTREFEPRLQRVFSTPPWHVYHLKNGDSRSNSN